MSVTGITYIYRRGSLTLHCTKSDSHPEGEGLESRFALVLTLGHFFGAVCVSHLEVRLPYQLMDQSTSSAFTDLHRPHRIGQDLDLQAHLRDIASSLHSMILLLATSAETAQETQS